MTDGVDDGLEAVGRRTRPAIWIGGWVAGLSVVVALAIVGSRPAEPPRASLEAGVVAASAVAASAVAASPGRPAVAIPRVLRPRPAAPSRPPLGEDGLMGGIVFGTAWPRD